MIADRETLPPCPGGLVGAQTSPLLEPESPSPHLSIVTRYDQDYGCEVIELDGRNLYSYRGTFVDDYGDKVYSIILYPGSWKATAAPLTYRHLPLPRPPQRAFLRSRVEWDGYEVDCSRDNRSRSDLVNYAVANDLSRMATLSHGDNYKDDPDWCTGRVRLYRRRLKRIYGEIAWVEVVERGEETGRLHHHLLLPRSVRPKHIEALWTEGRVDVSSTRKLHTLRWQAVYVTKTFSLPLGERVRRSRYAISRVGHERVSAERHVGTLADLDLLLQQRFGADWCGKVIHVERPWCEYVYELTPT